MIYRIDDESQTSKLDIKPNFNSPAYLRINGLYKAYGTKYKFIDFYTSTSNNLFICIKENFADIYIGENFNMEEYEDLKVFLYLKCSEIVTEIPLNNSNSIDILTIDTGNIYTLTSPIFDRVSFVDIDNYNINISNEISDCYDVAKEVFSNAINDNTYSTWYTDLSHRVRHGTSISYTIENIATVIAYAYENGVVLVSYLGTIEEYRNKGYGKYLLNHIIKELKATKLILQSQDIKSDEFYEKLGFINDGKYYNYKLM